MSLFFMVLFSILSLAYMHLIPGELRSATHRNLRDQGFYFTQAGAQEVWAWLRYAEDTTGNPLANLTLTSNTNDANWPKLYRLDTNPNRSQVPGLAINLLQPDGSADLDWAQEISLMPDQNTLNGGSPHVFQLKMTARFRGQVVYSDSYLLRQNTFANYGFFVDKLPSGGFYTAFRDDNYTGEFHINGPMPLYVGSNLFSNFVKPVFGGIVSFTVPTTNAAGDGVAYQTGTVPFDSSGIELIDSDNIGRYSKLASSGRAAFRLGGEIPMPKTQANTESAQAKAAWFGRNSAQDSLASQTIPTGVTLRDTGGGVLSGIYVKGDVRDLNLSVWDASSNQVSRDSQNQINSGNPSISIREESYAGTTKFTTITELRSYPVTIPSGVRIGSDTAAIQSSSTVVPTGSTLLVRPPGTPGNTSAQSVYQIFSGYPTGVVYVDGNIGRVDKLNSQQSTPSLSVDRDYMTNTVGTNSMGGVSGVNYGQARTIAVNLASNKYIRVKGDLTRGDTKPGDLPTGKRDGLGLVGYDVVIGGENAYASSTPMYLTGLLMAGRRDADASNPSAAGTTRDGSVIYENWSSSAGIRVLNSAGSYVVGNDRYWGDTVHGWMPTFQHDDILANSPPPFYPTRSDYQLLGHCEVKQ
ncbi:hypothetical protein JST97_28185 [bacterium]|nr:hypothetical protein [bacterium]